MDKFKIGDIVLGTVTGIQPYGIFVSLDTKFFGMIHISEVSYKFVSDLNKIVNIGDSIYVEILNFDDSKKHYNLSIKNIDYKNNFCKKKEKIIETKNGFHTLKEKLPIWINENL